jgi:hypothetical protein
MKWLVILAAILLAASDLQLMAREPSTKPATQPAEAQFITTVGSHRIGDTDDTIEVERKNDRIQFRIRDVGPSEPAIDGRARWFIAAMSANDVWVHLGEGRLFHYTWTTPVHGRIDEFQFPDIGDQKLPEAVRQKLIEQVHHKPG